MAGPAWIRALGERCGPLVPASVGFLEARRALDFPRGADGLAGLAAIVDAWLDTDADEEADRRFVEGAGALLGLLLVDHTGEGAYAARGEGHRVRLGRHGFFDPFGALEATLDADDPRATLAAAVRAAEAEARGEGPTSRVLVALERALGQRRPDLSIMDCYEAHVTLEGGIELDVGRVVAATRDQGTAAVERAVDKLLTLLPGGGAATELTWDEARLRLLPRLAGDTFLARLDERAGEAVLFRDKVAHDVHVALLLDHGDRARYVREAELSAWGVTGAEARAVAVHNLAGRSNRARFARIDTEAGAMVVARSGDGLDAARLLLPGLHDVLAAELGSPSLATVPHRDTLLACAADAPAMRDALLARTRDDAARAPHRISDRLFLVGRTGLEGTA